ncbi:hypothetical protein HY745_09740 [Candidatus Desantisbacteria bacterium]|nr:hypothetical protein [Candidatus Desantisbacteria bacterium]
MRRTHLYVYFPILLLIFIFSSCSGANPLSGLSWGSAILQGQVVEETKLADGTVYISGMDGDGEIGKIMIYTDLGNDYIYAVTSAEHNNPDIRKRPKSMVKGEDRYLEIGEFQMKVKFRIGSTAKSKKVTVSAYRDNFSAAATQTGIMLVDGQATLPVKIKLTAIK